MESVQGSGQYRLGLRLAGGLSAALAIGVAAGFLAANLGLHGPSRVVTSAPATSAAAPSTGAYADRDSRLPYQATVGAWADRDSRLPIATVAIGSVWGDRDSRLPIVATSDASLARGIQAQAISGDHDSRPPLAPFNGN
jgi:hypothetical protein